MNVPASSSANRAEAARLSAAISVMRFPLMVAVVCIHACLPAGIVAAAADAGAYRGLYAWLADGVARTAVPLCFWISGYLYFLHAPRLSAADYAGKLWRRARTLGVPYVAWNAVAVAVGYVCYATLYHVRPPMLHWSAAQWLSVWWNYRGGMPYDYPLWYVRNLMLMTVAAPAVALALRRRPGLVVGALAALWLWRGTNEWATLCFFAAGAAQALHPTGCTRGLSRYAAVCAAGYAVVCALMAADVPGPWPPAACRGLTLWGMAAVMALALRCGARLSPRAGAGLARASFWLYAAHAVVLAPVRHLLLRHVHPASGAGLVATYVALVILTVGLTQALYALTSRMLPRLANWLCGSR